MNERIKEIKIKMKERTFQQMYARTNE